MKPITIHVNKRGLLDDDIIKIVSTNNDLSQEVEVMLSDIVGFVRGRAAEYPTLYGRCTAVLDDEAAILSLSEDGGMTYTSVLKQDKP